MNVPLKKEIWPVMLPAGAVLAAAAVAMLFAAGTQTVELQSVVLALGCAYLAAMPFGLEFQERTFGLLLSQPVPRSVLWTRKMAVVAAIALSLGVVCIILGMRAAVPGVSTWPAGFAYTPRGLFTEVLISMALTACSACYWTLVARSIIGGAVFTLGGQVLVSLIVNGVQAGFDKWLGPESHAAWLAAETGIYIVVGAYGVCLLWLGWRRFSRLQVADVASGPTLLAGARLVRFRPRVLESDRSALILNLVRKEVFLHKPVYSFGVLFTACWAVAYAVRWLAPERISGDFFIAVAFVATVIAGLLAGSLCMAEERTLGTAEWHQTLPVSWKWHWGVKFAVAAVTVAIVGVALPSVLTLTVNPGREEIEMTVGQMLFAMLTVGFSLLSMGIWASAFAPNTVRAAALGTFMTAALILLFVLAGYVIRETRLGWHLEEGGEALLLSFRGYFTFADITRVAQICMMGAIAVVCLMALIQSWSFYGGWPGRNLTILALTGTFGLWIWAWFGWWNAFGSVVLILLLLLLVRKRPLARTPRKLTPLVGAAVLAAIAFTCWMVLLLMSSLAARSHSILGR